MMDALFRAIWEISLASIPAVLVLGSCANLLGRRYGVRWRHLLWMVVAVRLVMPIQFSLPEKMEGMRMELPVPSVSMQESILLPRLEPVGQTAIPTLEPAPKLDVGKVAAAYPAEKEVPKARAPRAHPSWFWVIGAAVFGGWQGWKYAAFRRMLKRSSRKIRDAAVIERYYELCRKIGLKKRPALYFCGLLPSPLCMGLFRQEIYINSEEREPEDLEMILKHELMHCKRRDLWFKALLLLARTLHFFNPFVHWMARQAERDMEYSCDAAVMRDCTMEERQAYSMAILRTVREGRQKGAVLTTAFSGGKKELKTRFENIFDMGAKKRGIALFAAVTLAVCCGTAFVGCQAEKDTLYGGYTEDVVTEIYQAKPLRRGDGEALTSLLKLLPMPEGAEYRLSDGKSLAYITAPIWANPETGQREAGYDWWFDLNWESTKETAYILDGESYEDDRWNGIQAMLLFALSEDVEGIQFVFYIQGDEGSYTMTRAYDREGMKRYFGETDLRRFAADEETFRAFVQAANKYFYDGINEPGEIRELADYDNASAQERMAYFLDEAGAGIVYGDYTETVVRKLYDAKLQYIGDHIGVGRIFGLLPMPRGVTGSGEGMELFTAEEPYGARLYLKCAEDSELVSPIEDGTWVDTRWFEIQGMIFLALVDNADSLEYSLDLSETKAAMISVRTFNREGAKQYFGETDLRDFAADEKTFQMFVRAVNRYFYEGINTLEDVKKLLALDDTAAQERMSRLLSEETGGEINEAVGMRQARELLSTIAGQKQLSSNPLDYIKCKEYEELVQMGQPALKAFLMDFAVGKDTDTLKGHIMKLACQDILGEKRSPEQNPAEWYFLYSAIDSTLCMPFAYDEAIYTAELEKYTFHSAAAEKFGILAAGQDERLRAVYDAVADRYNSDTGGAGHKTKIFAPVVYGWDEGEDTLSAYLILHCRDFVLVHTKEDGYGFYEGEGSSLPVRMDFERQEGNWTLTGWTEAVGGEGFVDSVNEMCRDMPELAGSLMNRAYGSERMILEQNIAYYINAHYGGMNIPVYLDSEAEQDEKPRLWL